jgi:hypothetical protein
MHILDLLTTTFATTKSVVATSCGHKGVMEYVTAKTTKVFHFLDDDRLADNHLDTLLLESSWKKVKNDD